MRHIYEFLGVKFKIDEHRDIFEEDLKTGSPKVLISCLGIGYTNINKPQL